MLYNNFIYKTLVSLVFTLLFHVGAVAQLADIIVDELPLSNISSPLTISVHAIPASGTTVAEVGFVYCSGETVKWTENYSTGPNITTGGTILPLSYNSVNDRYEAVLSLPATGKYVYQPYEKMSNGDYKYGSVRTFNVTSVAHITTVDASSLTSTSVTLNAFCSLPGTVKFYVNELRREYDAVDNGAYSYSCNIEGLNPNTTYHFKAQVIDGGSTTWGEELSFTTDELHLSTSAGSRGYFKAVLNGSFAEHSSFEQSGFIYGTSAPLDNTHGQKVSGSYTGDNLTAAVSVTPADNYYYVVYARLANGNYHYSSPVQTLTAPSVRITPKATLGSKSFYKASVNFSLDIDYASLDDNCTYGIVYSKTNNRPTIDDSKREIGSLNSSSTSLPSSVANLSDLEENTTYYYRPYLLHGSTVIYGVQGSFITDKLVASTAPADGVAYFHATLKGSVDLRGLDAGSVKSGFLFSQSPVLDESNLVGSSDVSLPTSQITEFSYSVTNLKANTTYYYKAYVKYGDKVLLGELKEFKTLSFTPLTQDYTGSSFAATLKATDILKGNSNISSSESYIYGIAWGLSRSLDSDGVLLQKVTSTNADAAGKYTISVANLTPGATLYYQAYVLFDGKYYGGDIKSFALGQFAPVTGTFSAQKYTSVTLSGTADLASAGVTADAVRYTRGFFYSTSSTLTRSSDKVQLTGTWATNSTPDFSCPINNLRSGVNYYYCAYVCYNNGTVDDESDDVYYFGSTKTFSTSSFSPSTDPYTDLTYYKVTLKGTIGMAPSTDLTYIKYGFVYSVVNNPVVNEANFDNVKWASSNTEGKFSVELSNSSSSQLLVPGMTYYYRAVVRIQEPNTEHYDYYYDNSATGVRSFTVPYLTPVTGVVDNACFFSATLKGSVDFAGAVASDYVYGIAYSEYGSGDEVKVPSSNINSSGVYSVNVSSLKANTVYNYRAYVVKNGTTTTYGSSHQFHTADVKPVTQEATSVSYFGATLNAKVVLPAEVTANTTDDCKCDNYSVDTYKTDVKVGFVYSDNSNLSNVTPVEVRETNKFDNTSGIFTLNIDNLVSDRTYYYKSFVKKDEKYYFGETLTLHTSTFVPSVSDPVQGYFQEKLIATMPADELLNAPSANLNDICGFIVSTNTNPTLSNSTEFKCQTTDYVNNGSAYTGDFSLVISNLVPGAHYYYRAFVKNGDNYYFSNIHDFETKPFVVRTSTVETTYYNAKLSGELNIVGEVDNYTYGFVYSTSRTPSATSAGSHFVSSATSGEVSALTPDAGKFNFSSTLNSLTQDVTYYYRAYVKDNNNQYYYAADISSFVLSSFKPTTNPITSSSDVTYFTANISGSVDMSGVSSPSDYTKGFFLSSDPGKLNADVSESIVSGVSQTDNFSATVNVLAGTKYYYCAYVKYQPAGGTTPVYYTGNTQVFTTPSCVPSTSSDALPKSFSAQLSATSLITTGLDCYGFIVADNSLFDNVDLASSIYQASNIVGTGVFSLSIPNLVPSHTYYYLPFISVGGVKYYDKSAWGSKSFTTHALDIVTLESSDVKYFSAKISGKVENYDDLPDNYEYGFVYSEVADHTTGVVDDEPRTFVKFSENDLTSSNPFVSPLTNLKSNTLYYFAAAVKVNGVVYKSFSRESSVYRFRTDDVTPVTSPAVSGVFVATLKAELKDASPSTSGYDYGFVYSTGRESVNSGIQILSSSSSSPITISGQYIQSEVSPLVPGKSYFYRAFALANSHYYWGDIEEFQTLALRPVVSYPTSLGFFSATLPCHVDFTGVNVTDYSYGIVIGENPRINAVTAFRKIEGSHITDDGNYSVQVLGLQASKQYYCRAYVVDDQGNYVYGDAISFTTVSLPIETVDADITSRTSTSITIKGFVGGSSLTGLAPLTNYGFVFSTSPVLNIDNASSVRYVNNNAGDHNGVSDIVSGNFSADLNGLTGSTVYYYRSFATYNVLGSDGVTTHHINIYGSVKSFSTEDECLVEWTAQKEVDLDLPSGIKWATCNVGASKSYESGDFFSWASTASSTSFTKDSYELKNYNVESLVVYHEDGFPSSGSSFSTSLIHNDSDDCAKDVQGEDWSIPTPADWQELIEYCNWEIKQVKGVYGFKVSSKSNPQNSIFLPAAGYMEQSSLQGSGTTGGYWSDAISVTCPDFAHLLEFFIYIDSNHPARTEDSNRPYVEVNSNFRYYGRTVRAVRAVNR